MYPPAELTLVRHGQTRENLMHILQGHMPGHLTEEGIAQVCRLRDTMHPGDYDCLLCSDLQRAVDTALILSERLGLPLTPTSLLRERDFGIYTGQPYGIRLSPHEPSLESSAHLRQRAESFLRDIRLRYAGRKILAVSHGLFLRVIQSVYWHKDIKEIFPMRNAETRTLVLKEVL